MLYFFFFTLYYREIKYLLCYVYIYACVRAFGEEWIVTCALISFVQPLGERVLSILTHKKKRDQDIEYKKVRHYFLWTHDKIWYVSI